MDYVSVQLNSTVAAPRGRGGFSRVSTDDANRIGTERARAQKHVGGIEMSPTPYNSSRCGGVSQSRVQHDDDHDDDDDEGQRVTPTRFARARAIGVPREQSERSAVNQTERQRQRETMQFTRLTGRIRAYSSRKFVAPRLAP